MVPVLGVLTALHGRHELSERMLRHAAASAPPGWAVQVCAAYSPEDASWAKPLLQELGAISTCVGNNPVSFKWQEALNALLGADIPELKGVLILGSDDFASVEYLRHAVRLLDMGLPFPIGTNRVWMVEAKDDLRAGLFESDKGSPSIGAGRLFPIDVVREMGGVLWPEAKDLGLDNSCAQACLAHGKRIEILDMPGEIFDVKSGENIHSFEKFVNWHKTGVSRLDPVLDSVNTAALLRHHCVLQAITGDRS